MEVRKTSVQQIIQPEIPQKSEVTKTKSVSQNLIPDSFEKENSQSSSSNSSSTASSEPEKKAGQITGGILIKQMTAARLGSANVNAAKQENGKKELSPEQQASVSNSDPQKKNLNSSYLLQDARSKDEDRKNSGLQPPFASNKGDASSKFTNVSRVGKDQVINATGSDQTSNAVKDANRFADGESIRTQVDGEVAERHQDSNALGGSRSDRLNDLLNPTAAGPQQSGQTYGKDQLEYAKKSTRRNEDGSITDVFDEVSRTPFDNATVVSHTERTVRGNETIIEQKQVKYEDDNTKVESEFKTIIDTRDHSRKTTGTSTTTKPNGTVIVETSTKTDKKSTTTTTTTTRNNDGSTTTTTSTTEKTTTPGGGTKSYDQENYTGNIPEAVKKVMDYFKQQAVSQKPSSGGETAHTDNNAEADPTVGGRVSNLVAQQGNLGLLGNPGSATSQTGPSGGQGHVGSSQSGGNIDPGQDSDNPGYTGVTHEDDPADVQFGSAEQPKEQTGKKEEESNDTSFSFLDPLRKKKA